MKALTSIMLILSCVACSVYADSELLKYGSHYYKRYDNSMNWQAAREFCTQKGGYLAVISSQSENTFIKTRFASLTPNHGTWLGGSDEASEGTWKWIKNQKWIYSNWSPGEPNNFYFDMTDSGQPNLLPEFGQGEHYLIMYKDGTWNDGLSVNRGTYDYQPMSSLCEIEL